MNFLLSNSSTIPLFILLGSISILFNNPRRHKNLDLSAILSLILILIFLESKKKDYFYDY